MSARARTTVAVLLCLVALESQSSPSAAELLDRTRAAYAELRSYADTATVTVEEKPIGATTIRESYVFTTRFATPRKFLFDFRKGATVDAERFVIWNPGERFSSWWSATGVQEQYAQGQGGDAFANGTFPTAGAALLIAPLLFHTSGLQGPASTILNPRYEGIEKLGDHATHKIIGSVRLNHWSDTARSTTIWIDTESLLIRKIFEDTPTGMGSAVQRSTTTLDPRANPTLDASHFVFTPPANP
jgi:outer membrane lipoprotein-sorting protein